MIFVLQKKLKVKKVKVSAEFHSRNFYSAAIAVTAFRALKLFDGTFTYSFTADRLGI